MVTSINSGASSAPVITAAVKKVTNFKTGTSAPASVASVAKPVSRAAEINAKAFMQRQQIGAALYDRSFTLGEGIRAMKTQGAIAAYAARIEAKAGGPTAKDMSALDGKLNDAGKQLTTLSSNSKGADLDSLAAIDGRDLDIVQENLMNRINAGLKDGTLTKEEGEGLLARQQELNDVEVKLRASDGKLTAGEQKLMLDQLRKTADEINKARHNNVGVNATYKSYSDGINNRQAALEKQLSVGIKAGSLTEKEVAAIREEFTKADEIEAGLRADGRVDWKDSVRMSSALNDVEIAIYELQRNKAGVQLKDAYVDVKHADLREAQQLESLARGISNKNLTDDESVELLEDQQQIQTMEERFVKSGAGLDRGEYLRLQSAMNDFSLRNHDLQTNKDRWTGILTEAKSVTAAPAAPVASAPVSPAKSAPIAPTSPVPAAATPVPTVPVAAVAPEVKPEVKVETKPEAAAPAVASAAMVSKPAARPQALADKQVLANKIGAFLTGMMKEIGSDAAKAHGHLIEAAKGHDERKEGREHIPADTAKFRSFDAYGKAKFASVRPNTGSWVKVA